MQLKHADLMYGMSRYPINTPLPQEVPFAPLAGALLEQVAEEIARATGCLDREAVIRRISHNKAIPEQVIPLPSGDLVVPAYVCLIGNGFSVIWT